MFQAAFAPLADAAALLHPFPMRPRFSMVVVAVVLGACSPATKETQSTWVASPSGDWLARIAKSDTAGPGVGYVAETVQVRQRSSKNPVDVVTLEEMYGPGEISLRWRDPLHLEVTYAKGEVVFQAVKVGNLAIETASKIAR